MLTVEFLKLHLRNIALDKDDLLFKKFILFLEKQERV